MRWKFNLVGTNNNKLRVMEEVWELADLRLGKRVVQVKRGWDLVALVLVEPLVLCWLVVEPQLQLVVGVLVLSLGGGERQR